jgi:hypothetical protein
MSEPRRFPCRGARPKSCSRSSYVSGTRPFRRERSEHCRGCIKLRFTPRGSRLDVILDGKNQIACRDGSGDTHPRRMHWVDLLPFPYHLDRPEYVHDARGELSILRVLITPESAAAIRVSQRPNH